MGHARKLVRRNPFAAILRRRRFRLRRVKSRKGRGSYTHKGRPAGRAAE